MLIEINNIKSINIYDQMNNLVLRLPDISYSADNDVIKIIDLNLEESMEYRVMINGDIDDISTQIIIFLTPKELMHILHIRSLQ